MVQRLLHRGTGRVCTCAVAADYWYESHFLYAASPFSRVWPSSSSLVCCLGYGVIGGTGSGLTIITPLRALMLWFPDKKGISCFQHVLQL